MAEGLLLIGAILALGWVFVEIWRPVFRSVKASLARYQVYGWGLGLLLFLAWCAHII